MSAPLVCFMAETKAEAVVVGADFLPITQAAGQLPPFVGSGSSSACRSHVGVPAGC